MTEYHNPAAERRAAVRALLLRLGGYGRLNTETIIRHIDANGSAETCENVRYHDRRAVNALVAEHNAVNEPARFWGPETDADRWTITGKAVASCA